MTVQLPVKDRQPTVKMDSTQVTTSPGARKSIIDSIPLKLVLFLAKPYLAGKSSAEAIARAHKLFAENKFAGTLDILGEDAATVEDCQYYVNAYISLIDEVAGHQIATDEPRRRMTISMKPSMFSTQAPAPGQASERALDEAFDRIMKVVDHAQRRGIEMTLEAEDHRWTNFHLETYFALFKAGYTNLGTVLQSRLFRTEKDIKRFGEGMRVRMVIGIYQEPESIAETQKPIMKDLLVKYAGELAQNGVYVEIASHDTQCIEHFVRYVVLPQKLPASRWETQFLLGVPRSKMQKTLTDGSYFSEIARTLDGTEAKHALELAKSGVIVRMYLPYGRDKVSGPYCRRRLKANPNMIAYGIKNVLGLE